MRKPRLLKNVVAAITLLLGPSAGKADMVADWNAIMIATVAADPFNQARFAAITQLAVFEAVNSITGEFEPYLGTIIAPPSASGDVAAIAAAHLVLRTYFPARAAALDASRAGSLAAIPDGPAKDAGIIVGETAAAAMMAARSDDGSSTPEFYHPPAPAPGQWQMTPSCGGNGGQFLHWRNVKPFGIRTASQFRLDPPPALTRTTYTRDYNEVKSVGSMASTERPADRADVARVYATFAPAQVLNPIARNAAQGKSLTENARALALLNMAISDAAVATFDAKYYYNLWRPETAIQAGDTDDNPKTDPDRVFVPFISAPCFPSYPSAHATLTNAGIEIVQRLYGRGTYSINVASPSVPGVNLPYSNIRLITGDVDDARVYGGIHFRFDQEQGVDMGRRIAEYVYRHNLRRKDRSTK
jgi:hypothetical protein